MLQYPGFEMASATEVASGTVPFGADDFGALRDAIVAAADDPAQFETLVSYLLAQPLSRHEALGEIVELVSGQMATRELDQQSALERQIEQHSEPVIAIVDTGTILAANTAARRMFEIEAGATYTALGIERDAFDRFRTRISQKDGPSSLVIALSLKSNQPIILSGGMSAGYEVILLSALQWTWPAALDEALSDVFGLSTREREVLAALSRGESVSAIAGSGHRSIGTIRQQIKAVLGKLGVNSQAQAVAFVSAAATALARFDGGPLARGPFNSDIRHGAVVDDYGRTIGVRRYGAPDGLPVLLLHGSLFGIGELATERDAAHAMGLDIIAPERPGYGRTRPCPHRDDLIDLVLADTIAVLDGAGIERTVVIAHDFGFCFAAALASSYPDRVCGIVGVSSLPPYEPKHLHLLPPQQRIFAWAAQNAHWMLDFLVRLGVARMRRLGATNWPQAVFDGVDADQTVASRAEILPSIVGAYAYNIVQDALGFRLDLPVGNTDWSAHLDGVSCPVRLLHGALNQTAPLESLRALVADRPDTELEVFEDAGHTLAFSHPALAPRMALALAAKAGLV